MIKDSDIFASCLKLKHKVVVQPDEDSIELLKHLEVAETHEKVCELIRTDLHSEYHS